MKDEWRRSELEDKGAGLSGAVSPFEQRSESLPPFAATLTAAMFGAGLEIDLALFRKARNKSYIFGLLTTSLPFLLGAGVGLLFGYKIIPALVIGSLLASHTLLALPSVSRLGETKLEPILITVGAAVISDTLSLVIFAICVPTFQAGLSVISFSLQIAEIAIFVPFVLFGVSRMGAWLLIKPSPQQNLGHVQADKQTGEPQHEKKRPGKTELVNAVAKLSFYPLNKSHHSGALQ